MRNEILIKTVKTIFFDFDGVLTNNKVLVDQNGIESVQCNRSDGIAFEIFKKLSLNILIISSEKNNVVKKRANKLKVRSINGVKNKSDFLRKYVKDKNINFKNTMYVGNDINDFHAMKLCGYTACPNDSHKEIKKISTFHLKLNGGEGIAREVLEDIFQINSLKYYNKFE